MTEGLIPIKKFSQKHRDKETIIEAVNFFDFSKEIQLNNPSIAIISINDDNLADFYDTLAWNIRENLYNLFKPYIINISIYDLGYFILNSNNSQNFIDLVIHLINNKVTPIVLSKSKAVNLLIYKAIETIKNNVSITEISNYLPLGNPNDLNDNDYLSHIISNPQNKLFNFSNLGYQLFNVSSNTNDLYHRLLFDSCRMGQLINDISVAEPPIRDSDFVSIDLSSVRASDAPATIKANPNGFSGFNICQMSRFAGLSNKVKILSITGILNVDDNYNLTSTISGQILWFFLEAFFNRKNDFPNENSKNYKIYIVENDKTGNLKFFHSVLSDRWWVEFETNSKKNYYISCLFQDYKLACDGEIPDRLWKIIQKLT